jgi:hypothetical protein
MKLMVSPAFVLAIPFFLQFFVTKFPLAHLNNTFINTGDAMVIVGLDLSLVTGRYLRNCG